MRIQQRRFRYDLAPQIRKIEAGGWENARALGFYSLGAITKELNRLGKMSYERMVRVGQHDRFHALWEIRRAIKFGENFGCELQLLLGQGSLHNIDARRAIEKIKASEAKTAKAA
jgi:hypothetical protein